MRPAFIVVVSLWLVGCTAHIPDEIYACNDDRDCPSGFACGPVDDAVGLFCSRERTTGSSGSGGDAGTGAGSGGNGGSGGADAGPMGPLVLRQSGFTSVGGSRSGDGLRVSDGLFEASGWSCSSDRRLCVSGGFEP